MDSTNAVEGWISTYTGKQFNWEEPEFDIHDIAHSLSNLCRFGGHCSSFYSVAEHSVLVSYLTEGDPLEGLLHDACEAYVGDLIAPLKQICPDFRAMEDSLEEKFRGEFALPPQKTTECNVADVAAVLLEGRIFIKPEIYNAWKVKMPEAIEMADKYKDNPEYRPQGYTPQLAKFVFLSRYNELQKQAGKD